MLTRLIVYFLLTIFTSLSVYYFIDNNYSSSILTPSLEGAKDNAGMGSPNDRNKCIFCRIADGKEQNEIFFEDEEVIVFEDIKPAAKFHFLVIPKEHIKDSKALVPSQLKLLDRLIEVGNNILGDKLAADSYIDASKVQKLMGFHWPPFHSVAHLHLHVIAPSDEMGMVGRAIFRPNSIWFVTTDYVRDRLIKMGEGQNSPAKSP